MKRLACLCVLMAPLQAQSGNAPPAALQQIEQWVDTCPASDPAIQQIRLDFDVRLDNVPVTRGAVHADAAGAVFAADRGLAGSSLDVLPGHGPIGISSVDESAAI